MSIDFLNNQIIKATLKSMSRSKELDANIKSDISALLKKMRPISDIKLTSRAFNHVFIHANSRVYRLLISVCELIFKKNLLSEDGGVILFRDFYRDEKKMAKVYERFIFNFLKRSQDNYKVSRERLRWNASSLEDPELLMLPTMMTDISLKGEDKHIVIDTKYYTSTLAKFYGSRKIHSENLYQINSYLQNIINPEGLDLEGILLYPVVDEEVSKSYILDGKTIRIETIDLSRSWYTIEQKILSMVGCI